MLIGLIVGDLLMAAFFALKFTSLPPQLPIFYSRVWGEDQLADYWYIFLLPILMHLFIIINHYVYNRYFLPDTFIKRIITTTNWFMIIAFTITFIKIIFTVS